jgi:AP-1-like transcription factor
MASTSYGNGFDPANFDLLPNEQQLLRDALNSNRPNAVLSSRAPRQAKSGSVDSAAESALIPRQQQGQPTIDALDLSNLYNSPIQAASGSASLIDDVFDTSPYLDYDLEDGNVDWDASGDQLFDPLPGNVPGGEDGDLHEKRKSHGGNTNEDDGGGKRREGEEKSGRKPGRKPLTSEPTSVS